MTGADLQTLLAHAGWLRKLALRLADDAGAAEDAVQETLIAALRAAPSTDRSVRPWLAKVLRNALRHRRRTEMRRETRERIADLGPLEAEATVDAAAQSELYRTLAREVHQLSEPYRTTIVLRYFEGKSTPEIAAQLGVIESTIRTRLERGHKRLRERLDGRYEGREAWAALVVPVAGRALPVAATSGLFATAWLGFMGAAAVAVVMAVVLWRSGDEPAGGEPPMRTAVVAAGPADGREASASSASSAVDEPSPVRAAVPDVASIDTGAPGAPVVVAAWVHDEAGAPVAGSRLEVAFVADDGTWLHGASETDAEGRLVFALDHAVSPPEPFRGSNLDREVLRRSRGACLVRGPGHATFMASPLPLESLPGRGTRESPFELPPIAVDRGVSVSGTVRRGGSPVPGARLLLTPTRQQDARSLVRNVWIEAGVTGEDGRFELTERVTRRTARDDRQVLVLVLEDGRLAGWTPIPVAREDDRVDVAIEIASGGLDVRVVDATGRPVPGATVELTPFLDATRSPDAGGPNVRAMDLPRLLEEFTRPTDAAGAAAFDRLPVPGGRATYRIHVRGEGYAAASSVAEVAEVDENAGGRSSPITIRLNEETFCTIQAVDSMNRPLAGLRVLRDELPVGETDAQGRCRIDLSEDAPAVMVHVEGAGYARTSRMLVPPAQYRGADVEMRVPMALTTTLRLVDRTGRLVPDVGLALAGEGQDMQATHSDFSAGLFTFEETGPGSHRVVLAGEGRSVGDWVLHPPVVVEGGARDVVVVADRIHPSRSRLILRLVDAATGAPLRPASVRMRGTPRLEGGGVLPWRFLDDVDRTADGVDAAAVPPGEYVLELTFDGRPEVVVPVEVEAGRALLEETVRVSAGATLVVELDGFDLAAGAGAIELELRREAWFEWDAPRPVALVGRPLGGDRRLLRVEGLAAGRGELRVRAGGREWVTPVEVPATGEGWVRVDME